jgi:hypothetical protein
VPIAALDHGQFGPADLWAREIAMGSSMEKGKIRIGSKVRSGRLLHKFETSDVFCCLMFATIPFVLLAVNNNWFFSQRNTIDPWFYAGFHLHLLDFLRTFGDTYYASRVPWTVTGWLLHTLFGDTQGLYVLHFGVFYLAVFSLYIATRIMFINVAAACGAALLLATNSYFLNAVGWDYVDGPGIAWSLAGFAAMISSAIKPHWRLTCAMWGICASISLSLHLLLTLLVLIQIGMFLLINRVSFQRSICVATAWFTIGGAAAMFFLV